MVLRILAIMTALVSLGCSNMSDTQLRNTAGGAAVGATAGVLIGDNKESAATGAIVGGLIGSQVK